MSLVRNLYDIYDSVERILSSKCSLWQCREVLRVIDAINGGYKFNGSYYYVAVYDRIPATRYDSIVRPVLGVTIRYSVAGTVLTQVTLTRLPLTSTYYGRNTMVHELLHARFPLFTEDQVIAFTDLIAKNTNNLIPSTSMLQEYVASVFPTLISFVEWYQYNGYSRKMIVRAVLTGSHVAIVSGEARELLTSITGNLSEVELLWPREEK